MDMDDDVQIDDLACPACGHHETRSQPCHECDEAHEEVVCCDDLCVGSGRCIHGDGMAPCRECSGTGIQRWCPKCAADYWRAKAAAGVKV
jgi:hypothetical protein